MTDEDGTVTKVKRCIYTPHSLRATTATLLLDAGVDIIKVKELLGHRHVTTTQIYDKRRRSLKEGASHDVPICGRPLPRPRKHAWLSKVSINAKHLPGEVLRREGFVEHKIEIGDEDLEEIIREYLERHADFDFDEVEMVNNRPTNIWLYAKCRKYVDRMLPTPSGKPGRVMRSRGERPR